METNRLLIDEQFLEVAYGLVKAAEHDIYIATFKAELTTKPRGRKLHKLFDLLFEKVQLGVEVRFLINRSNPRGSIPITNLFAIQELKKQGIKIRCLQNDRICHAKILISDHYAGVVGSHNLSVKSCHNNFEVSYLFYNSWIVNDIRAAYNWQWEKARKA